MAKDNVTTGAATTGHHVETFIVDFTRAVGWHCLTCNAMAAGFPTVPAAERAGEQHADTERRVPHHE